MSLNTITEPNAEATSEAADATAEVRFDTKVVVVLRDDVLPWQELNVTAFLMSGIATSEANLVGQPYRDADDNHYLPMLRQPVLVMTASAELLAKAREKAAGRELPMAVYTEELFSTGHDAANRAAVAEVPARELNLVGIAIRGPKNVVDRIVKGARMHD
ncbi:DUF2000 domain-containing protein [Gulosibacter molinativorax]|uniref:DUF2000 domain-containing protein n=1 Tax=Gulosibacter molinativorax TaxID=256821 RepID=A0ABT7C8G1_9MICO|nr:DUF2000 domain-containing protein [Gulosibacter molinativorax]MDJ1371428.1 DUF2000 domain-containing protein [Gulosibacter molinativorax]QUY62926.1 Uncharacterized protein-like protein [Gulosibacter molinativorax]